MMNIGDKVTAVFMPVRRDDLNDGVEYFIGKQFEWRAAWVIESGPYEGQLAMQCMEMAGPPLWVPLCDLALYTKKQIQNECKTVAAHIEGKGE